MTLNAPSYKNTSKEIITNPPTFCDFQGVLSVIILGELFAIILSIASSGTSTEGLNTLALSSLYIQWNGLIGLIALCILRPYTQGKSLAPTLILSWILLLLIIAILSYVTFWLLEHHGLTGIIPGFNFNDFFLKNMLIGGLISGFSIRYFYIHEQWKVKIEAESKAKLQLLQARIRPHFLFNSMNTIASLCRSDPYLAEQTTEDLADLFQPLMLENKELTDWEKEIQLSEKYLGIEALRFGDRLEIQWEIKSIPKDTLIPILTLQPLLENAIHYGVEPSIKGGFVQIKGSMQQNQIRLMIKNDKYPDKQPKEGNKIALHNIKQRLQTYYGDQASLEISNLDKKFIVYLSFPYLKKSITNSIVK